MSTRVALVTEIAAPYRVPVFNELAALLEGDLDVYFTAWKGQRDWDVPEDEIRFRYEVLGALHFDVPYRGDRQPVYLAAPLLPRLVRGRYDVVVVGGWSHLECLWALAYARLFGKALVVWSETPLLGRIPRRPLRSAWKRLVIRSASGFVVPGESARRYLMAHGAAEDRIHLAPNAVDSDFWSEGVRRRVERTFTLLYVGRLVESKGVDLALEAFGSSALAGRARFLIAGDGDRRAALERAAPPGVEFLGSQDRVALRRLYGEADMLVFPSRYDPWGLVLNEAACAGLAAVATDGAGATRDMVVDGANGLVVRAGDVASLREAFDRLAAEPELAATLGSAFRETVSSHTPAACASGIFSAVAAAASAAPRRSGRRRGVR